MTRAIALLGITVLGIGGACADERSGENSSQRALTQPGSAYVVVANEDGSFTPSTLHVREGDLVVWNLQRGDTVVPVGTGGDVCSAARPYDPLDPNEFVGPMPVAPGGIFTISPPAGVHGLDHGLELVVQFGPPDDPCGAFEQRASVLVPFPHLNVWQFLCASGPRGATMAATWQDPDLTGVFIRRLWSDVHLGPGQYDFRVLDREIEQAVANGKLYSLSFTAGHHGTPEWTFETGGVARLTLQDQPSHPDDEGACGPEMDLGAPNDVMYQTHYFDMLTAVADHLKSRADWYRALAYIKPSGANLFTSENRLPKACEAGCICNPEVWSGAGYTSTRLQAFFAAQHNVLARAFPGKTLSYQVIQDGFPRINAEGGYVTRDGLLTAGTSEIGGLVQTQAILDEGQAIYGTLFAAQHNGLQPKPDHACPNPPGLKGCPQPMVVDEGAEGQLIGFQTQNIQDITNSSQLESAFENAWDNSTAGMIEIYEERLWQARVEDDLDIAGWDEDFRNRRASQLGSPVDVPSHAHRFVRTTGTDKPQAHVYINGTRCDPDNPVTATIFVDP